MGRSHKLWIDATGGSARGFGIGNDDKIVLKVRIGSSATNSSRLSTIRIGFKEKDGIRTFEIIVDGHLYRKQEFDMKKKTFGPIISNTPNKEMGKIKQELEEISKSITGSDSELNESDVKYSGWFERFTKLLKSL